MKSERSIRVRGYKPAFIDDGPPFDGDVAEGDILRLPFVAKWESDEKFVQWVQRNVSSEPLLLLMLCAEKSDGSLWPVASLWAAMEKVPIDFTGRIFYRAYPEFASVGVVKR